MAPTAKRPGWSRAAVIAAAALALVAGGYHAFRDARPAGPKIVFVGMDALTWDLLDPMLKQGRLPNLKGLIDRGSSAPLITLRSSSISATIWTSILTGKLPKKHGVNGWFSTRGFVMNSTNRPDAYFVYFEGPDEVEHFFWKYMGPEFFPAEVLDDPGEWQRYYKFMDKSLGEILAAAGPDALVIVCSGLGQKRVDLIGQDTTHSGEHRLSQPPGVLILAGPHVKRGYKIETAAVTDIAPTILYLSGLPVGADMDGKVLLDAIEPAFVDANPVRKIKSWDEDWKRQREETSPLDREVKEKLRALGYLE